MGLEKRELFPYSNNSIDTHILGQIVGFMDLAILGSKMGSFFGDFFSGTPLRCLQERSFEWNRPNMRFFVTGELS